MKNNTIHKNLISAAAFIFMVILCNGHLVLGQNPSWFLFRPEEFIQGQWWRIFTHPFSHVSFYHLTIDLTATCLLLSQIRASSTVNRHLLFSVCSLASLLAVVLFSPHLPVSGYCGLSGTAHGLMSFLGMQWVHNSLKGKDRQPLLLLSGGAFLASSAGKSIFEVISGQVLFSGLHLGQLGIPLVHAHLGGAIGGDSLLYSSG